jgi:hypothetical protein
MKSFRPAGLKKTKGKSRKPGRDDPQSDEDHRRYQGANGDARCHHLPGHEDPFVDFGPVAAAEEGKLSLRQSTWSQEGGAV